MTIETTTLKPGESVVYKVDCPAGKKALGGGAVNVKRGMVLASSHPLTDGSGWQVIMYNASAAEIVGDSVFVQATCASVAP